MRQWSAEPSHYSSPPSASPAKTLTYMLQSLQTAGWLQSGGSNIHYRVTQKVAQYTWVIGVYQVYMQDVYRAENRVKFNL